MDDLDRLYYEFVDILRRERDAALTEPLTVHDVHERLIPYRRVRNSVGFRSNDDYEAALSRLLAGERGYLLSDGPMQGELKAALAEPLPDIRRYRDFPEATVWLNPEEIPLPGDTRFAPPDLPEHVGWVGPPAADVAADERQSEPELGGDGGEDRAAGAPTDASRPVPLIADGPEVGPPESAPATGDVEEPGDDGATARPTCPDCDSPLPDGAVFCPFCGRRLLLQTCGACGAELEPAWRFCAACGAPAPGGPGTIA